MAVMKKPMPRRPPRNWPVPDQFFDLGSGEDISVSAVVNQYIEPSAPVIRVQEVNVDRMNKAINEIAAIFFLNTTTAITSTKKTTPTPTAQRPACGSMGGLTRLFQFVGFQM
jgi:hypothetical protein